MKLSAQYLKALVEVTMDGSSPQLEIESLCQLFGHILISGNTGAYSQAREHLPKEVALAAAT